VGLTGGQKSSWTSTTIRAGLKSVAMVLAGDRLRGEEGRVLGGGGLLVVVVAVTVAVAVAVVPCSSLRLWKVVITCAADNHARSLHK
jgi:NhaP-type Na+/H+ or K+/H+ antiporter